MKKILSLLTALCLAFSIGLLQASADEAEQGQERGTREHQIMAGLEILAPGNGTAAITRGELADAAVRMLGLAGTAESGLFRRQFSDVEEGTPYAKSINLAAEMGIVSGRGSGMFVPDDPISYQEIIKILVCAVEYGSVAETSGGYPYGYLVTAAKIGMTKNTQIADETAITRQEAAALIYQTMQVELPEVSAGGTVTGSDSDETLMTRLTALKQKYGVVTETAITSLDGGRRLSAGYVEISIDNDPVLFQTGTTDAEELLGMEIELYAIKAADGELLLKAALPRAGRNDVMELDGKDIEASNGKSVTYQTEDMLRSDSVSLAPDTVYLYNGVYEKPENLSEDDLQPENGTVRLLDRDNDGEFELYSITDCKNLEISSMRSDKNETVLYFKAGIHAVGETTILSRSKKELTSQIVIDGSKTEAADLEAEAGMVCTLAQSRDKLYKRIFISTLTVEGTLDAIERGDEKTTFTVGGEAYELAPEFEDSCTLGEEYSFTLTYDGKLFSVREGRRVKNYAYVVDFKASVSGVGDDAEVKLITADGEKQVLKLAEKVRVDAATYQRGNALAKLTRDQVIIYSTNSRQEINKIELPVDRSSEIGYNHYDEDDFTLDVKNTLYYKTSTPPTLGKNAEKIQLKLNNDVLVFDVSDQDSNEWSVLRQDSFVNDESYVVEVYDNDKFKSPAVVVNRGCFNADIDKKVLWNAPALLIERVSMAVDDEGETVTRVIGMENGERVERDAADLTVADEEGKNKLTGLAPGSVIQCKYDYEGRIKLIRVLHRGDEQKLSDKTWNGSENLVNLYTVYGFCEEAKEDILTVTLDFGASTQAFSTGKAHFYLYNTRTKTAEAATYEKLKPRSAYGGDASKILIRVNRNDALDIIIYD